jgi:integrase
MDWSNITNDGQTILMRPDQTKNDSPHSVPVFGEFSEIIERRAALRAAQRKDGTTTLSQFVFTREDGTPVQDFRKAWAHACKAGEKPGLLFHDLRRSAVSGLVAAGVSPLVAMTISGHQAISVFKRYAILMEDSQMDALAAVQDFHKRKVAEAEARRKSSNVIAMA